MDDLISKLGVKPKDPATHTELPVNTNVPKEAVKKTTETNIGEDIMSMAAGRKAPDAPGRDTGSEQDTNAKATQTKEEPTGTGAVADPDSWTKDSALKEIKHLREENKAYRIKYDEKLNSLQNEAVKKLTEKEKELEQLRQAQQELEDIKAKEADKKRSLEDKLAHREALLTELKSQKDQIQKDFETKLNETKKQLDGYHAEIEAQKQVYQTRLQQELSTVPEKFRDLAELITKGAGDPREAIVALSEAKIKGLFEDKTVVVNHSVPGAKDGARATKERLEEAGRAERGKLSSSQKIKEALKEIRSGGSNAAFSSFRK